MPTTGASSWCCSGWSSDGPAKTSRFRGRCRLSGGNGTEPSTRSLPGGLRTARRPIAAGWMGSPAAWRRAPPASWPPQSAAPPTAGMSPSPSRCRGLSPPTWCVQCDRCGGGCTAPGCALHRRGGPQPSRPATLGAPPAAAQPRTSPPPTTLPTPRPDPAQAGAGSRRAASLRRDALHKLTTTLATQHGTVVIEQLNVAGMIRNRRLARALADAGLAELRRQLTYKTSWYGSQLIAADRFYPSSKTCSACGWVKAKLTLAERTFACETCGLRLDRDLHAACNLAKLARQVARSGRETKTPV